MSTPLVLEYEPRPLFVPFHQRTQRWACMVVHRRSGKTVGCVNDLTAKAIYTKKKNARFAYIGPFYRQTKDIAWTYLKEYAAPIISKIRESELRVELINGAWITLYGADNPDSLRGIYLDGVILDEFGDMRPSLWGKVILPTLIDRKGWAVFIGTPKGKNQFYRIHQRAQRSPDWYHLYAPASTTNLIDPEELAAIRAEMSDEEYEQEIECSFEAALLGAIYARYVHRCDLDGRLTPLEYDPSSPVHVAGDIGRRDATAMWHWQDSPQGVRILDYDEHNFADPEFFDEEVFQSKPWSGTKGGGGYGILWLPHDAKAKTFATTRTTEKQFRDRGYTVRITPSISKHDGIEAGKLMLRDWAWFNAPDPVSPPTPAQQRIEQGLDALRAYRRDYNETKDAYSDTTVHDWSSNGADGWRYLSIVARQNYKSKSNRSSRLSEPTLVTPDMPAYHLTLEQMFKDREDVTNWNPYRIPQ